MIFTLSRQNILKSIWRILFWQVLYPLGKLGNLSIRYLKYIVARSISKLPVSSEIVGPPQGIYSSVKEWVDSANSPKTDAVYQEILPAHRIDLTKPSTIGDLHWEFNSYPTGIEFPSTFIAIIPQGRIWSADSTNFSTSAILTDDDMVLEDVSIELKPLNQLGRHLSLSQIKLPTVHKIDGNVAVLASAGGSKNYFHWVADVLPRFYLLKRSGINLDEIDRFVVNSFQEPYQKESLSDLGIPQDKLIESSKYVHIKADRLIVPSLPAHTGSVPLWVCDFIRDKFLHLDMADRANQPKRIYVSRSDANSRRITNETDLIGILLPLGFSVVILSSLTVQEQASLFANAEVIIGPHSSGFTNFAFCQPGTKVIEIFSPLAVARAFWLIASQLKLDYYYLLGEGEILPKDNKWGLSLLYVDITVNINAFIQLLELAGLA